MKKTITLLIAFVFGISNQMYGQFPAPYCGPIVFSQNEEPITLVNFAGINNASPNALAGPAHQDFIAVSGMVTPGQTYPITLKGNTDGDFNTNLSVFMDWNHNNVFTDVGERYDIGSILNSTGIDAVELNGSITVPATALAGPTRMRVVKRFNNSTTVFPDSCNTDGGGWGEAEDYTLNVSGVIPGCFNTELFPPDLVTIANCNGVLNIVAENSYAGEYFEIAVTSGQSYTFNSSVPTDFMTISTDGNLTAAASGVVPIAWVATVTATVRVNINTNAACGAESIDRITTVVCGTPCLNGGLYPEDTYMPACTGNAEEIVNNAYAGEYSNVVLQGANTYTFASSVLTDIVTIATADGSTSLATGVTPLTFSSPSDGTYRVYFHLNTACGVEASNRQKTVTCQLLVLPNCVSLLAPGSGTTFPINTDIILSWEAATIGTPPISYNLYFGDDINALQLVEGDLADTFLNIGQANETNYGMTFYWAIVPVNVLGEATGCLGTPWSFSIEPDPTLAIDTFDQNNLKVYPNPFSDVLNLSFDKNISKVSILNILGQEVMTKTPNSNQLQMDLSSLASGSYILKVSADNEIKTVKLVKE